jgi:hypothetical protein
VRIKAGLSTAGQQAQEAERAASEEAGGSGKPRQRRLSLLLYFADAHWHTGEVEMWPQGQQSKVGQVGMCVAHRYQQRGSAPMENRTAQLGVSSPGLCGVQQQVPSLLTAAVASNPACTLCSCLLLPQGAVLLSGDNEDIGPWALHLLPGPTTAATPHTGSSSSGPSKAAAGAKLHFLGMRLQDGQQLVQLRQFVAQALIQTAQRLG